MQVAGSMLEFCWLWTGLKIHHFRYHSQLFEVLNSGDGKHVIKKTSTA
jgi:hypothetical protein